MSPISEQLDLLMCAQSAHGSEWVKEYGMLYADIFFIENRKKTKWDLYVAFFTSHISL